MGERCTPSALAIAAFAADDAATAAIAIAANNLQLLLLLQLMPPLLVSLRLLFLLQVKLQFFSSLQLYNSKVINDNAMYALTPNSTWRGQPCSQQGDYRASPGGALPAYMGAQAGVQLGTYPMRIMGFGLEARMLPAAGCQCKKPARVVSSAKVLSLANVPSSGDGGSAMSALAGLV
jgi:hypothetical protein